MVLGASSIWGTTGTARQFAHVASTPAQVGAVRLVVGACALLGWVLATGRGRHVRTAFSSGRWRWTVAAGSATAVYQAVFFRATAETGVAIATVVALGSAPPLCGLLGRHLLGETLSRAWAATTACAVAGCALLLLPSGTSGIALGGIVLALAAGACYAVYTVCAKRLLDDDADTVSVLAATLGVGAALSVPTFCAGASGFGHADGVLLALWLGGAATAGAYVLFAGGLARVSAATAGTLSLAEPLMAAALGIAVLAERPPAVSLAGAGALILGLALNPVVDTLGPVGPSLPRAASLWTARAPGPRQDRGSTTIFP